MLITLTEWAESTFKETMPDIETMRRWHREGKFSPKSKKIGRTIYVEEGTVYVGRTRSDIGKRKS